MTNSFPLGDILGIQNEKKYHYENSKLSETHDILVIVITVSTLVSLFHDFVVDHSLVLSMLTSEIWHTIDSMIAIVAEFV